MNTLMTFCLIFSIVLATLTSRGVRCQGSTSESTSNTANITTSSPANTTSNISSESTHSTESSTQSTADITSSQGHTTPIETNITSTSESSHSQTSGAPTSAAKTTSSTPRPVPVTEKSKLGAGWIAVIVLASLIVLLLAVLGGYFAFRLIQRRREHSGYNYAEFQPSD